MEGRHEPATDQGTDQRPADRRGGGRAVPLAEDAVSFVHGARRGRYLINSLLVAGAITALSLVFNLMAGYAFAKLRFPGRERLFHALLGALVIPAQVAMLPLFLLLKYLGLVNSYAAVVAPAMATVFGIFLVRQYTRGIPDELLEAARIDAALLPAGAAAGQREGLTACACAAQLCSPCCL